MSHKFNDTQHFIFYDMGAGSTVATLAKFHNLQIKDARKKNKTVPEVEILAVGYDNTLGGNVVDVKLQRFLASKFTEISGSKVSSKITDSPRAMAKLLKEANRVKQILSANQDTMASV
jgi:hypoxia up-regulated 1